MIELYQIKNKNVYPIFKNGRSSVIEYADQNNVEPYSIGTYNSCQNITVYIREPFERFVSGVHSFIEWSRLDNPKLDDNTCLWMIEKGKLVDEHFTQQWHWIKNLAQYYKNNITLEPVSNLYSLIPDRYQPAGKHIPKITFVQEQKIKQIKFDLSKDYNIWNNYLNTTHNIKEFIDVLSKN
jgi:hypothetical protein